MLTRQDKQDILLWRQWRPQYSYPATFSALETQSIGGTCSQLLWHARALAQMGHRVQVLGVSRQDLEEEGIDFIGAATQDDQVRLCETGRVRPPEVVILEGAWAGAPFFRQRFPKAATVLVGQNIDPGGSRHAFSLQADIDVYAFVGPGQLAQYSVLYPRLRHKFLLLRNCVAWTQVFRDIPPPAVRDQIIWVGFWGKKGLRTWAEVMAQVLAEHPSYRWIVCGPSYGTDDAGMPPHLLHGLALPKDRVVVKSLPMRELAEEVGASRVVTVSFGNECLPISTLDAHAMGRPVISGNDMVYKYVNPTGTGIRVTDARQAYAALSRLLESPALCDRMGSLGREFVLREHSEEMQRVDLQSILDHVEMLKQLGPHAGNVAPTLREERLQDLQAKLKRKWLELSVARSRTRPTTQQAEQPTPAEHGYR